MNTITPLLAGIPTIYWGPPGVGKTAWLRQVASTLNLRVETLIGSCMDPTDILGFPVKGDKGVSWALPEWWMNLEEGGVLYLDELSCSPPAVQAAMLRLVGERSAHDKTGVAVGIAKVYQAAA